MFRHLLGLFCLTALLVQDTPLSADQIAEEEENQGYAIDQIKTKETGNLPDEGPSKAYEDLVLESQTPSLSCCSTNTASLCNCFFIQRANSSLICDEPCCPLCALKETTFLGIARKGATNPTFYSLEQNDPNVICQSSSPPYSLEEVYKDQLIAEESDDQSKQPEIIKDPSVVAAEQLKIATEQLQEASKQLQTVTEKLKTATEHLQIELVKAERLKAEQVQAELAKEKQAKREKEKVEQSRVEQAKIEREQAEREKVEQAKIEQERAEQLQIVTEQVCELKANIQAEQVKKDLLIAVAEELKITQFKKLEEHNRLKIHQEISQGYRIDKLTWNISGHSHDPNVLTELIFKNIRIYQTRLTSNFSAKDFFATIQLGYGNVQGGKVEDTDYAKNNYESKTSHARRDIKGSCTLDGVLILGKNILTKQAWTVSPLVGYTLNIQKLRFGGGVQTVGTNSHGDVEKMHKHSHRLSNSYKAQWNAPFIGLRVQRTFFQKLALYAEYDLLFALKYNAHGYWNTRHIHFKQSTSRRKGYGQIAVLGAGYELLKNLELKAEFQFSLFKGKGGLQEALHHEYVNSFRKVRWMSSEVRLSINYVF